MTKSEWLNILSHYQVMCQLPELPAQEYVAAMYDELKHIDGQYVAYAVRQIIANETSYNRYPMLADINKWLPNFRPITWDTTVKGDELKRLQSQHIKETHVLYEAHRCQIRRLLKDLTGDDTYRKLTDEEITNAVRSTISAYKAKVLGKSQPLLLEKE